jgi:hypothetical protein
VPESPHQVDAARDGEIRTSNRGAAIKGGSVHWLKIRQYIASRHKLTDAQLKSVENYLKVSVWADYRAPSWPKRLPIWIRRSPVWSSGTITLVFDEAVAVAAREGEKMSAAISLLLLPRGKPSVASPETDEVTLRTLCGQWFPIRLPRKAIDAAVKYVLSWPSGVLSGTAEPTSAPVSETETTAGPAAEGAGTPESDDSITEQRPPATEVNASGGANQPTENDVPPARTPKRSTSKKSSYFDARDNEQVRTIMTEHGIVGAPDAPVLVTAEQARNFWRWSKENAPAAAGAATIDTRIKRLRGAFTRCTEIVPDTPK